MRKNTVLIVLAILALGLIGTGFSALYEQGEFIVDSFPMGTIKVSYGFPLVWYGYSYAEVMIPVSTPRSYWFSLESFLLDIAFWVTISFLVWVATMKSVSMLRKRRASKNLSVINM